MEDKVLEVLKNAEKALRAKEIARVLKCTRKEVNSVLYGNLGKSGLVKKCHDEFPTWALPQNNFISREELLNSDIKILIPPVLSSTIFSIRQLGVTTVKELLKIISEEPNSVRQIGNKGLVRLTSSLVLHKPTLGNSYDSSFKSVINDLPPFSPYEEKLMVSSISSDDKEKNTKEELDEIEKKLLEDVLWEKLKN